MQNSHRTRALCLFIPVVLLLCMGISSCVSSKKIKYFQGSDTLFTHAQKIAQTYEMRIKPADELLIRLTCSDEELLKPFAQTTTMGSSQNNRGNIGGMGNSYSYLVNKDGQIRLPQLGYIPVANLTTHELERLVEQKIRDSKLVPDPVARIEILSAHVTVIGATSGVVNLRSPRTSIIDVLSQLGDLPDTSRRHNIRLFREENGKRKMYKLDLTKADVFSHPAYYVQQNDIIYIDQNKSINIKSSPTSTFLAAGGSILGAVISLINMAFWIKRKI